MSLWPHFKRNKKLRQCWSGARCAKCKRRILDGEDGVYEFRHGGVSLANLGNLFFVLRDATGREFEICGKCVKDSLMKGLARAPVITFNTEPWKPCSVPDGVESHTANEEEKHEPIRDTDDVPEEEWPGTVKPPEPWPLAEGTRALLEQMDELAKKIEGLGSQESVVARSSPSEPIIGRQSEEPHDDD